MKRLLWVLIAVAVVLTLVVPAEAEAAGVNHDGSGFTIGEKAFVSQYKSKLKENGYRCSFQLVKDLSDSNYRFYTVKDAKGNFFLELHLYVDTSTKKLEAVRVHFDPTGCTDAQLSQKLDAMLLAYHVANVYMTDVDWQRVINEDNAFTTYDGYGFSGTLYAVPLLLTLGDQDVQLLIE